MKHLKKKVILLLCLIGVVGLIPLSACTSPEKEEISSDAVEKTPVSTEVVKEEPKQPELVGQGVLLTFDFARQNTLASNQFAVWIEDSEGNLVKTLYATRFTARGGYETREDTLKNWVAKAKPAEMSTEVVDTITGATPNAGLLSYIWDCTDHAGNPVAEGSYTLYLEGTLFWTHGILYSGVVEVGGNSADITMTGTLFGEGTDNEGMISNVTARYQDQ